MVILGTPSTASPFPGPFPALVSTFSRQELYPGMATDTVPSAGPKPPSCPAQISPTGCCSGRFLHAAPPLSSPALPGPGHVQPGQDPAPHQPSSASPRQPPKRPAYRSPHSQSRAGAGEPGPHPSRAHSPLTHKPSRSWRARAAPLQNVLPTGPLTHRAEPELESQGRTPPVPILRTTPPAPFCSGVPGLQNPLLSSSSSCSRRHTQAKCITRRTRAP